MTELDTIAHASTEESRYRLLIDAITDYAIYMLDPDGRVTSWNAGAERSNGYTADEAIGEHFSRFYTKEDQAAGVPQRALDTAAREGRFERESWQVRKDRSRFWADVVIDAIRSPSGELIGFAKITRDLTERRMAEETLRQSEQQFRLLVQGVTDYAIFMLNRDGRVASWNAGAQRIKGYAPEEIIGEHFSRFYTEEDRARRVPHEGLETARREGRWEREGLRVRKDGTTFWAHVIIDAIRDDRGEVIGFAKITRDVTERRQAQLQLEQAREALFQAQKMEAIGQLTGGVAHDFNNLLMAALSSLELLRKRMPPSPRLDPLVENALQAVQRGAALTQRMLAFARRQELNVTAVDVRGLVGGMIGFLQRSIGPGVRIEQQLQPDLPAVRTDANQLESAILNLAVNARDAMPSGGEITISAWLEHVKLGDPTLQAGDYVVLSVADGGVGMDEETVARAADPFFTTKGVGKGTGLGLSMVHGLAVQSGGALRIRSRVGQGTTVEMWLPATAGEGVTPHYARSSEAPRSGPQLVVMVVDDDELVLTNTSALLEDLGHFVIPAASGAAALEALERHPDVDAVLTDHAMPSMTGAELARAIERVRPELPVIIATGYADALGEAGDGLQRLRKPFTEEQLSDAIQHAVGSRRALQRTDR